MTDEMPNGGRGLLVFADAGYPVAAGTAFTTYEHDPRRMADPGYVDLRSVIRRHAPGWLENLSAELAQIAAWMSKKSRWWWCLSASRLDARPWGDAAIIKPLMVAHALGRCRDGGGSLTVLGAPPETAAYFRELFPNARVEVRQSRHAPGESRLRTWLRPYVYLLRMFHDVMRHHALRPAPSAFSRSVIVLFQSLGQAPLADGHRYFFTSLFDDDPGANVALVSLGIIKDSRRPDRPMTPPRFALLDWCQPTDVFRGLAAALFLAGLRLAAGSRIPGRFASRRFWRTYLARTFDLAAVLEGVCSHAALRRLAQQGTPALAVYPYEEKGIERAILFACAEAGLDTIGYCQHPQPMVVEALRDQPAGNSPKPRQYAFCGDAYGPVFSEWARKRAPKVVWGTAKSGTGAFACGIGSGRRLRLLVLLSHALELRQFHAWLDLAPRILEIADLRLRMYKADNQDEFNRDFLPFRKAFPAISLTEGTLAEDVAESDVVLFCATSAGPEAILMGRLAIFADLNDAFDINPCFNNVAPYLPCRDSDDLVRTLERLLSADRVSLAEMFERQRQAAAAIFSPVSRTALEAGLAAAPGGNG